MPKQQAGGMVKISFRSPRAPDLHELLLVIRTRAFDARIRRLGYKRNGGWPIQPRPRTMTLFTSGNINATASCLNAFLGAVCATLLAYSFATSGRLRTCRTRTLRAIDPRRLRIPLPRQPACHWSMTANSWRMAYMGRPPRSSRTAETAVLLHGRQLPVELLGARHQDAQRRRLTAWWCRTRSASGKIIEACRRAGAFRHPWARNTVALLDHLHIAKAEIVAHSMGRHARGPHRARAYPDRVAHLVADRADRLGGLPPIRAADARRKKIIETEDKPYARGLPQAARKTNYFAETKLAAGGG